MYAPGLPSKATKHPIPEIKKPTQFEFGLHEHHADKAGKHFDLRLGDPETGHAHSWAMRYWPKPGEMRLAVQQPTHTIGYMDFKGVIEDGYGKGKVDLAKRGKAEVLNAGRDRVRFKFSSEEYLLHRTGGDKWLLHNVTKDATMTSKLAFSTNAFSGPMNPTIATGASYQPPFKVPGLKAPVQQKTAEEFKLQGHASHQGLGIAIENQKGSVRKGTDKDGKPWRTIMQLPYGYIKGTKGSDGEEVDCYLGPKKDATHAFVVHQKKEDGSYDEDKVMLGHESAEHARKMYLAHYNTDKFLGPIKTVPMDRFKQLIESGKKLVKISASAPTRGNFMMASDIPSFKAPSLRTPVEKNGDMLPTYVPGDDGQSFKKSKYAAVMNEMRVNTNYALKNHLDRFKKTDPQDRGEIVAEDGMPVIKMADVSPTQPLGNGGGNPHRMESWLASPKVNSLSAPLNKVAEPSFIGAYWGGPGAAGRGPVNEAGFRQASDQNGPPTNSLRAPLRKVAAFGTTPMGAATAAKKIGTTPAMSGGTGPSIADISKPKGMGFGGPIPGADKTTIGGFNPISIK